MTRRIDGIDELRTLVGQRLGESYWVELDQPTIDLFADVTHDHNWVHVDPVRAADSPFHTTIAHGFHSLALIGGLIQDVFLVDRLRLGLNYGVQKARFPNAVPVGSRVRLAVTLTDVVDSRTDDGADVFYHCEVEIEGQSKPACAADIIFRYFPELA
jgi:acyl dehydratase